MTTRPHPLHPLLGCLAAIPLTAQAVPPLVHAAEVAGESVQVYVQAGRLLVSQKTSTQAGLALRPLEGETTGPLPPDLDDWTHLPSGDCSSAPSFRWKRGSRQLVARLAGDWSAPVIEVLVDDTVVATSALGRPAKVCSLYAGNLDALPGEEVLVMWRTKPEGPSSEGLTVMRIPATAE